MADRFSEFYPLGIPDVTARNHFRARNHVSRMRLDLGDDTGPAQVWQAEGYPTELRTGLQVLLHPNFGGMPLRNASAVVLFQGGNRGFGTVIGIEDGRYRGRNYQGGEAHVDLIDGASASDGTGGTRRPVLEGLLGWITKLWGVNIIVGDPSHAKTVDIYGATSVTVHTPKAVFTNGGTPSPVVTEAGPSTVLSADA